MGRKTKDIVRDAIEQWTLSRVLKKIKKEKSKGKTELIIFPGLNPRIVKKLLDKGYDIKHNSNGIVIQW